MSRVTDLPRTAVPQGVASFLPDLADRKRQVEERLLGTLGRWGYREVIPPLFEYLDVLAHGLVPETVARGYKVEDRQDGRLMVLRPDVTAQVARMAAARKDDPHTPHRFGYASNVFTQVEAHRARPREMFQVGAELLGPGGVAADVEILALLITALREMGLREFVVAMGQSRFFHAILEGLELDADGERELTQAMRRKDGTSIRALLGRAGVAPERIETVARIPYLIGGTEVFAAARALTRCADALAALAHLEKVVAALTACGLGDHVMVDLGEIRDMSYYTGIVFEVLVPALGTELGGGGRYDDLVGRFGHPMHATGFALDVERLMEALARAGETAPPVGIDYVVHGPVADAHRVAQALRAAGFTAVVGLPGEAPDTAVVSVDGDAITRTDAGGTPLPVTLAALTHAAR
ncbi:MAG: ATP phosphoribosyltransferase regulatory subunit [Nitrospirae bacterium]|nr:ATP phosphoribosyltransferase regulatory subunit [Nitrospirota bacterium]